MISIITPTFNRAKLIGNMIESVTKQTHTDWELIIVDDGSKDNTEEVIKRYTADKRIHYIKKENSGATCSRNIGVSQAKGDYITFLDSDDEAYPKWVEKIVSLISEKTAIICLGAIRRFEDGRTIHEYPSQLNYLSEKVKIKFTCGSLIIKREIFDAVGGYDINLKSNQHTDLGFRLLKYLHGSSFEKKFTDDCLVQINVHHGARIRNNWNLVYEGGLQFLDKHFDYFHKNDQKGLAAIYGAIAFGSYKLNRKKESIKFTLKAIKCNPRILKNYFRLIRYAI